MSETKNAVVESAPHLVSVPEPPDFLVQRLTKLEEWALQNQRDAKADWFRFWALKLPAILVSASAGFLAGVNGNVARFAGVIGGVCVVLDGIFRAGSLRSVHLRAVADIRTLENDIEAEWTAGSLRKVDLHQLAARIVDDSEKEKKRIASYLQAAETAVPSGPENTRIHRSGGARTRNKRQDKGTL